MVQESIKKILKITKDRFFSDPYYFYKQEKHLLDKPFFFEGDNGEAILLIHGWTTTPYELRRLGIYLNEKGYTISAPLLTGHGTVPKNLEGVSWAEWFSDVENAYLDLKKKYKKVYVGGTSIGASLSLVLAKKHKDIAGIILMAAPYRLRIEWLMKIYIKIESKFKRYHKKKYPPTFGKTAVITRLISYQTYPLENVLEAAKVVDASRKNLSKVEQPCFLLQSANDHIVSHKSMDRIFEKIGSKKKKKKYIKKAYHTFISDIDKEYVFEDIFNFLQEN